VDPEIPDKLEQILAAVREYEDPRRAMSEWKQVYKLLQKTSLSQDRYSGIVGMRNVEGLADLIKQLKTPDDDQSSDHTPDAETCKKAFKAFKKRTAMVKLEDESKLGHGPFSKGEIKGALAIEPPLEWPKAVWQELVRQGKLRDAGYGLYELVKH
jgi:hypothetical protein